jgi:serine-type D-Ala-D-Ala carboxypeptidase/endopeptidase (penicillin-binding protein 4)
MGVRLQGWRRILISPRAQRRSASLDRFAAVSKEADTRLAGLGLLVRGRHALYVSALAALLASRGARVWEAHDDAPPRMPRDADVAILESPLPADLRALSNRGVPVIVLAERDEPADALAAAQLGARALLPKNCTLADLSIAIRNATGAGRAPHRPSLTPRQREVLELIVEGLDNTQIASRLGITERTVRAHVSSVLERTGVANRTQAAVAAIQRGWVATLLLALTLALVMTAGAAAAIGDPAALRAALSREMRSAGGSSGAWVYDGGAGRTVFKWNAAKRRVPASVQKLVTTTAALDRLGSEARFETAVLGTGDVADGTLDGDLYVRGSGDPTFGTKALGQLADLVAETGVERVTGRVWGDESFFDRLRGGPASRFGISPYVGPLSALAFNRGGLWPFGRGWQADPASFVAERLRIALRREDVAVTGHGRAAPAPGEARTIAALGSPPLASIVRHTNQVSDNYYAETLLKGLGARAGGKGSTAAGARVARAYAREAGFAAKIADGSGLSRGNRVAPRDIGRLLLDARTQPWFDEFYRSLPLAGVSGTLHDRMHGTRASGRCRAKTGTLAGVTALAGYCRAPDGDPITFALLMNGINVWRGRHAQDRVASLLASYTGPQG